MANDKLKFSAGGFTAIPNSVVQMLAGGQISKSAFCLYVYLTSRIHHTKQVAWPSYKTISHDVDMSRATISAALEELEAGGMITRTRRFGQSTIYELLIPEYKEEIVPASEASSSEIEPMGNDQKFKNQTTDSSESELLIVQKLNPNNKQVTKKQETNKHILPDGKTRADEAEDEKPESTRDQHNRVRSYLEEVFCMSTGLQSPDGMARSGTASATRWWKPLMAIAKEANWDGELAEKAISAAVQRMWSDGLDISAPQSIEKATIAQIARIRKGIPQNGGNGRGNGKTGRVAQGTTLEEIVRNGYGNIIQ